MTDTTQTTPLAVVTGASTGIGRELARELAGRGYDVLVTADEPEIDAVAAELGEGRTLATAVQADLATPEGVAALLAHVQGLDRPVDVLCLNAGTASSGPFVETPWEDEARVIALNVTAVVQLAKGIVPEMARRGSGRVLITSSIAGTMPSPWFATYAASKVFESSFAEALRHELKDTGVTVTALMPGPTDTEFFDRAGMEDTRVAKMKKDDPAEVAREGVDALLDGKDKLIPGSMKNRVQAAVGNVLPQPVNAALQAQFGKRVED